METPGYYAVIPASVRYDPRLKPNEKLLYGEITALSRKDGYCFATNRYFASLYRVTKETVSHWVSHLQELGYVGVDMVYTETGAVGMRRIILFPENLPGPLRKKEGPPLRKKETPPCEKTQGTIYNNTRKNTVTLLETEGAPPQEDAGLFGRFWQAYPKRKGKEAARKAFLRLGVTGELLEGMLAAVEREKQSRQWQEESGRYIPYPATWLNQRRWEDEPDGPEEPAGGELPDYLRTYL